MSGTFPCPCYGSIHRQRTDLINQCIIVPLALANIPIPGNGKISLRVLTPGPLRKTAAEPSSLFLPSLEPCRVNGDRPRPAIYTHVFIHH